MTTFPVWWPQPSQEIPQPADHAGMWVNLQNELDIKASKPKQAEGVVSREMMDGSGHHFMLKNGRTHTYVRLSPEEFWIWQHFSGEKTVQQIVLDYFMEYKSFAFAAVVDLIGRLTESHMLSEQPRHLYADISRELQEQTFSHKITWLARTVFTREWSIKGLDSHLDRIYKYGGWILFTLPLQIAFFLVSVIGTFLFFQISKDPQYALFGDEAAVAIIKLGLLSYIPLIIHEFGHAITAKHVGCEVYKGGVMLYYGLPAAFVDTTDVWLFGKRARLAVTWAGPYTGYIISGISGFIVYFWKDLPVFTAISILQIGLIGFFSSTMNILPLLKLDGYYILADWLEIPRLRERSMEFLSKRLRPKLAKREKWAREEYIFFVFGLLAFLSTIYFTYSGIRYWDFKTTSSISSLFTLRGDTVELLKNIGTILLAVSSIAYFLYLFYLHGSSLVSQLRRIGLLSHRVRSALVLIASAIVVVALLPVLLPTLTNWFLTGIGIFVFSLAAWISSINYRRMQGSIHVKMWLAGMIGFTFGAASFAGEVNVHWAVAGIALYEAGLVLSLLIFIFAGRLLRGLRGSWRSASMVLLVLGVVIGITGLFVTGLFVKTLAAMVVLGGLLHWNMRPTEIVKRITLGLRSDSTREQMVLSLQHVKHVILHELELDFGTQTRNLIENGGYRKLSSTDKTQRSDDAEYTSTLTGVTPSDYGGAMALMLEDLLIDVEKAAGQSYAKRVLALGFDSLDWELQELTEDYLLKYVRHAGGLSQQLKNSREDVEVLLRSVPLFMSMSDRDISALSKKFKSKRYDKGESIIQQGGEGDLFYLIRAGSVEVMHRFDMNRSESAGKNAILSRGKDQVMIVAKNRKVATFGRGDTFGEAALLTGEKRNATVRAITSVDVLWLSRGDFDTFVRENFDADGEVRATLRRLSVLRQIPLFSAFEGMALGMLEKKIEEIKVLPGETIFRQGDRGNHFYIIEEGKVIVHVPYGEVEGEKKFVERVSLGTGEYFGEISLLMGAPRTATVIAAKPTTLLRLESRLFSEILNKSQEMKKAVERASTRRLLSNERWRRQSLAETIST